MIPAEKPKEAARTRLLASWTLAMRPKHFAGKTDVKRNVNRWSSVILFCPNNCTFCSVEIPPKLSLQCLTLPIWVPFNDPCWLGGILGIPLSYHFPGGCQHHPPNDMINCTQPEGSPSQHSSSGCPSLEMEWWWRQLLVGVSIPNLRLENRELYTSLKFLCLPTFSKTKQTHTYLFTTKKASRMKFIAGFWKGNMQRTNMVQPFQDAQPFNLEYCFNIWKICNRQNGFILPK